MERTRRPHPAAAEAISEPEQTPRVRRSSVDLSSGPDPSTAGGSPANIPSVTLFPPTTRIRRVSASVIRRAPGDDLEEDLVDDERDDVEPPTRTGTRTIGPKWRSKRKERERARNWNARGAERSRGRKKQERGRARDLKYQGDDDGPDPQSRIEAEQREQEERETRERQEIEERERQERARQERERQEAEDRKQQEAERLRREEKEKKRRAKEDSLKNWSTAVADDPELFKARAMLHLRRLTKSAVAVPEKDQTFVASGLTAAEQKISQAKGKRTQEEAIAALKAAGERIEKAKVDVIGPLRTAAKTKVEQARADVDQLRKQQNQPGPGQDLASTLAKRLGAIERDADDDDWMSKESHIKDVDREAEELIHDVASARQDVVHFQLFTGSYGDRQLQLEQLRRGGVSVVEMTTLMPLVPAAGGTRRGEQLVLLCKEARHPQAIGLAGLAQVLPTPSVNADQLVHVIVLGKVMNLTVINITANLQSMQDVASKFPTTYLDWFTGFSWANVTSLVSACNSARVRTFSEKVKGVKICSLLNSATNALTAAELLQYEANPEILDGFAGMTDGGWSHVISDTHYDPAVNTISGGHNEASFDTIYNNPPDGVTFGRTLLRSRQGGAVKKYEYTATRGTKVKTSSKTVITGLRVNEQAWRQAAERATQDALKRGRFWADGDWDGTDGAISWAGKHKNGFVTTAYPKI